MFAASASVSTVTGNDDKNRLADIAVHSISFVPRDRSCVQKVRANDCQEPKREIRRAVLSAVAFTEEEVCVPRA